MFITSIINIIIIILKPAMSPLCRTCQPNTLRTFGWRTGPADNGVGSFSDHPLSPLSASSASTLLAISIRTFHIEAVDVSVRYYAQPASQDVPSPRLSDVSILSKHI